MFSIHDLSFSFIGLNHLLFKSGCKPTMQIHKSDGKRRVECEVVHVYFQPQKVEMGAVSKAT
jgi:hypothetical protein